MSGDVRDSDESLTDFLLGERAAGASGAGRSDNSRPWPTASAPPPLHRAGLKRYSAVVDGSPASDRAGRVGGGDGGARGGAPLSPGAADPFAALHPAVRGSAGASPLGPARVAGVVGDGAGNSGGSGSGMPHAARQLGLAAAPGVDAGSPGSAGGDGGAAAAPLSPAAAAAAAAAPPQQQQQQQQRASPLAAAGRSPVHPAFAGARSASVSPFGSGPYRGPPAPAGAANGLLRPALRSSLRSAASPADSGGEGRHISFADGGHPGSSGGGAAAADGGGAAGGAALPDGARSSDEGSVSSSPAPAPAASSSAAAAAAFPPNPSPSPTPSMATAAGTPGASGAAASLVATPSSAGDGPATPGAAAGDVPDTEELNELLTACGFAALPPAPAGPAPDAAVAAAAAPLRRALAGVLLQHRQRAGLLSQLLGERRDASRGAAREAGELARAERERDEALREAERAKVGERGRGRRGACAAAPAKTCAVAWCRPAMFLAPTPNIPPPPPR
jgi:hypothetical protein